jgi:uncharacterized protein
MSDIKRSYSDFVLQHPGKILAVLLLFVLLMAIGLKNLSISNDFRVYFSEDNPQLMTFDAFEEIFTPTDNVSLIIVANTGDVFTRRGLDLIEKLTKESWQIPSSILVTSFSNFQHVTANGDTIESRDLVENAETLTDQEITQIKTITLSKERLVKRMISADGVMAGIFITLQLNRESYNESNRVVNFTRAIRDRYQKQYPEFKLYVGGSTTMNSTLAEGVENDLEKLLPLSYFIIFGGLIVLLRSVTGTIAIGLMVSACLIVTFGFFGFIDPILTPVAGFVPSILLSIIVADSVHILSSFSHAYHSDQNKLQAIRDSLDINLLPVTITSATTIVGFLCLNFSDSPPYRALGNMIASGVVLAWVFSLTVLPALIYYFPMRKKQDQNRGDIFFSKIASFVITRQQSLLVTFTLLSLLFILFIPANRISDNWAEYFDDSFEVRKMVDIIDGKLTGVNFLEYVLTSKLDGGISNPKYLNQVEAFGQWYEQQKLVVSVNRYTQILKEFNQLLHKGNSNWHKIPATRELAAQFQLLYELTLPHGLGTDSMIDISKTSTRMTVSIKVAGTDKMLELDNRALLWLQQNAPAIKATPGTGLGLIFAHIVDRNINSLLFGTALALVLISLLLIIVFCSWRYGLISLIPNIIPAVITYGLWGMLLARIDMCLAIVACATLGIVVDDTVHFMHKYLYAKRRLNMKPPEAVDFAFRTVGKALFITSVVLVAGFAVLGLSHMFTTVEVGIMMSITIAVALIVDFLFLPPLLLLIDKQTTFSGQKSE